MKSIKDEIAKNLLYYRKKANLTQKELADAIGVKHGAVSSWENGINSIDTEILFNICKSLNISVSEIFGAFSSDLGLSSRDATLITAYRKLNEEGQSKVDEYMDDLIKSGKYIKNNSNRMADKKQA